MSLIRHVDALFQILVGLAVIWLAYRPAARLGARARTTLKLAGPALVVIGAALLAHGLVAPDWQRRSIADGAASAEFPGAPRASESTDSLGGISVRRSSLTYNVPGRDIALFLSASPLPGPARALSDADRVASTLSLLVAQGSRVIQNEKDPAAPVYRITLRQDAEKATTEIALAYVGDGVYRAVATWTDGQEDRRLVDRFIRSFHLSGRGP